MSYFTDQYSKLMYPIADANLTNSGLRNAQLGAIHAIAAHFTVRNEPAVVVMPTGSGKTAVLFMSAFIERANRVLVITPSRLVRNQIKENFLSLNQLTKIGVFPPDIERPRVFEVIGRITDYREWQALEQYDVVVGTPNSVSPSINEVPEPPQNLFDLILIDEAHHSPAVTWNGVIKSFPNAKCILFTATPFRRDKQEIKGKFVYNYPIRNSYADRIFGDIEYIPVLPVQDTTNDVLLAQEAERVFRTDRDNGYQHYVMVRTDTKNRAVELKAIYGLHTSLNLRLIHSGLSYRYIRKTIKDLRENTIDGIICVNMLGEGFDFPNLKIGVIHAPHKSLEVTLQFIGRFARTGAGNIGRAKFLAIPSDIEIEAKRLYEQGAVWQEIVSNLSQGRVEREDRIRESLETFSPLIQRDETTEDLSLYSLYPARHVKVFRVGIDVDISQSIKFPIGFEVVFHQLSQDLSAAIFIVKEVDLPKWTSMKEFRKIEYNLIIVYFYPRSRLLFINSSKKADSLFDELARHYSNSTHKILPLSRINRILSGLSNYQFFNIGMKNRILTSNTESYRIIAGANAQNVINATDGQFYNRGHIFAKAEENDQQITIGYSSSSKIWSNQAAQVPDIIEWCQHLAEKIDSDLQVLTDSGLDYLTVGEEISSLPGEAIIASDWNSTAYKNSLVAKYEGTDGYQITCQLLDLDVDLDRENTTGDTIRVVIRGDDIEWPCDFSLNREQFFRKAGLEQPEIYLCIGNELRPLIRYLNDYPLDFYTSGFSRIRGNEYFPNVVHETQSFDRDQIVSIDWRASKVDITKEVYAEDDRPRGQICLHDFVESYVNSDNHTVVIYDHRSGEIADFLTFSQSSDNITISLFHCKKSSAAQARSRVDDLYEVCGQAVKSTRWFYNHELFQKKINKRIFGGSRYVKGTPQQLEELFEQFATRRIAYSVTLVQPGISQSFLTPECANILASADRYIRKCGGNSLFLLGSA